MKNLILINGTMGAGKTTVSNELQKILPKNVFLDGDWCWMAQPFVVTDETKEMVMENITFLLAQFLRCSAYENVIFCWVMDHQEIIDELLGRLEDVLEGVSVHKISLVLTPEALAERLQRDVDAGIRSADILTRAPARLALYDQLDTVKLDASDKTPAQLAQEIARML